MNTPFEKATEQLQVRVKPSEKEAYKRLGNVSQVVRNMLNEAVRRTGGSRRSVKIG